MKRKILSLVILFGYILGCTPEPDPILMSDDRKIVDSLYLEQVNLLKPGMDSLCNSNFDARVQRAVDSMLTERQAEIEAQIERLNAIKKSLQKSRQ